MFVRKYLDSSDEDLESQQAEDIERPEQNKKGKAETRH